MTSRRKYFALPYSRTFYPHLWLKMYDDCAKITQADGMILAKTYSRVVLTGVKHIVCPEQYLKNLHRLYIMTQPTVYAVDHIPKSMVLIENCEWQPGAYDYIMQGLGRLHKQTGHRKHEIALIAGLTGCDKIIMENN